MNSYGKSRQCENGGLNDKKRTANCIAGFCLPFLAVICGVGSDVTGSLILVRKGRSPATIVLSPGASPSEELASKELQSHFRACTGVTLPIVEGFSEDATTMIVLGCGQVAEKLGVEPSEDMLGEQGFLIKSVGQHVVIAGSREAGTLYGVYAFLEDYLGVRWYTPDVTKTPKTGELVIPAIDRLERPAFLYRHTSYRWPGGNASFFARVKRNAGQGGPNNPHGMQYRFLGTCHTYFRFIHPEEYFETHPEYFSEIGGVRRREETQLCLTNPNVLDIVANRLLALMKQQPNVRQFNFSQMDYYNYCQCSKCRAMNQRYGTLGGTQFWFVNELAKRTSIVYPDKYISTLAYMYTEEPPKDLQMHPNVAVWLCHMYPSCDSHPVAACPRNADYKRRAIRWSKICSHLYIWHYIVNFAHYYVPFPNLRALASDMRFYRDIGVEGLYLQGMGHAGGGGEFSLLRPYYAMKLAWNPDQNAGLVARDFLRGYYGAAWRPIWKYVALLHDRVEDKNIHMHLYTNPAQGYLSDEIVDKAALLFDEAERAVKHNPELLERVRVARMPLTYARMFPRNGYEIKSQKLVFLGQMTTTSEINEFIARMKRHGFATLRESFDGQPEQLLMLNKLLNSRPDVISISNDHLTIDVVPVLAGRALRIIDNKSGQCVTAYNVRHSLMFPFCGGLETRVGGLFRWYGWMESSQVIDQTPTSIVIALKTMDGFDLTRTLELVPDEPVLRVRSMLSNPGDKPRSACLRSHLELNLGDLGSTRVRFTDLAGRNIDKDMMNIIAGLREGEHYRNQNAPRGSWTFTGSKGLQLTQRFDNSQVEQTWLYAYPEDIGELEVEIWANDAVLAPGQSIELSQDIEVHLLE